MIKHAYLVTCTGFIKQESGAHAGRTFTFEVVTDGAWAGKHALNIRDEAFREFHCAFGMWPAQPPSIVSVVEVGEPKLPADLQKDIRYALENPAPADDGGVTVGHALDLLERVMEAYDDPSETFDDEIYDDLI